MKIGILGAGKIGPKLAQDALTIPGVSIGAVGSRSLERAEKMALELGADQAFGSYESLLEEADVDLIYVATPHTSHAELTIAGLDRGIPVLCEKAFAMNFAEAEKMVKKARENQVFLMEAMWSRFMPSLLKAKEWLDNGFIGDLCHIKADFGFRPNYDPNSRLFDLKKGGGSLLDIGLYPVFLALFLSGKPESIDAQAILGKTGVDEELSMLFKYADHLASLQSSFRSVTPCKAQIIGSEGTINIHSRWHHSKKITLSYNDDRPDLIWESDAPWTGYRYEVLHVKECLETGKKESPLWSLDNSLEFMQTLDRIREKINLNYS
ncbi:MAG: Gfo/Idh/MocA family oxidoreductase [Bacteroidetes bacterium]|nr:Gfo/Idh/MocA family oxidoreductase [Bacteroidota bacterium]